jgi:hypothetical protein
MGLLPIPVKLGRALAWAFVVFGERSLRATGRFTRLVVSRFLRVTKVAVSALCRLAT